ncbi:MAG: transporter substrate-binding domain-containing protein [Lentilitoribacter sp.]
MAQAPIIPNYFDAQERIPIADVRKIERLRFLTTVDFPPFSFLDENGRLTGFHVDLARNICSILKIIDRCQIQAIEWKDLPQAIQSKQGDAMIAGFSISADARKNYLFSRSYLELPARFIALNGKDINLKALSTDVKTNDPAWKKKEPIKVGVARNSAHEAMLKNWFPKAEVKAFDDRIELYKALKSGDVNLLFGDGLQFSFWLSGEDAGGCCEFVGGPYLSQYYLGEGLAVAVTKDNADLLKTLNYGLSLLGKNGNFAELYLRYFPNGIY